MNTQDRLNAFGQANAPFYMVDHDDGSFSLCLVFSFLKGDYVNYGQDAFNAYAREIGEPITDGRFFTHGDGYEWSYVFQKAFENNPDLQKIHFDCEAGGFFCYCRDLDLLEKFGTQFREICEDPQRFTPLVIAALMDSDRLQQEQEKLSGTVKGFLTEHLNSTVGIVSPQGYARLSPDDIHNLMNGNTITMLDTSTGQKVKIDAEDILSQHVVDYSSKGTSVDKEYLLWAESAQSEDQTVAMTM